MGKLDDIFDNQIKQLNPKEQVFFRKLKNNIFTIYNNILKPILWAIALFWLFGRIKNIVGYPEVFFVQGVVIIIFLRLIASRLA
jgi:hypothetical protein